MTGPLREDVETRNQRHWDEAWEDLALLAAVDLDRAVRFGQRLIRLSLAEGRNGRARWPIPDGPRGVIEAYITMEVG